MSLLGSAFPAVVNTTDFDLAMYNRIVDGITSMVAVTTVLFANDEINLDADEAIHFGEVEKLTWSDAKVQVDRLEIASPFSFGALSPAGDCVVTNDFKVGAGDTFTINGDLTAGGDIITSIVSFTSHTVHQCAEPDDPADGTCVLWCSNGEGAGDVGDIMVKIQWGASVKAGTLVDFA